MSAVDFTTAYGRLFDKAFAMQVTIDAEKAVKDAGLDLTPAEIKDLRTAAVESVRREPHDSQDSEFQQRRHEDWKFAQKTWMDRVDAQVKRANRLGEYTVDVLEGTLDNAKRTYKLINAMNVALFVMGLVLFVSAAFLGVFRQDISSIILGGLGVSTFVTLFLLGPIKRSQEALANLVQVEVTFMNMFEQLQFWETYVQIPNGAPGTFSPQRIENASKALQKRSEEAIRLLQQYVEGPNDRGSAEENSSASTRY